MNIIDDFNAVGDGTTDDTAALQSAAQSGHMVEFPAGTYLYSDDIELLSGTTFVGEYDTTVLKRTNNASIIIGGQSSQQYGIGIEKMAIINYTASDTASLIIIDRAQEIRLTNLHIGWYLNHLYGCSGIAIEIGTEDYPGGVENEPLEAKNVWMRDCRIALNPSYPGIGVKMRGGGGVFVDTCDVQGGKGTNTVGWLIVTPLNSTFDTFSANKLGAGELDFGFCIAPYGAVQNIQVIAGGLDTCARPLRFAPQGSAGLINIGQFDLLHIGGMAGSNILGDYPGMEFIVPSGCKVNGLSFTGGHIGEVNHEAIKLSGAGLISNIDWNGQQYFNGSRASSNTYRVFEYSGASNIVNVIGPDAQIWNDVSVWAP